MFWAKLKITVIAQILAVEFQIAYSSEENVPQKWAELKHEGVNSYPPCEILLPQACP